MRRVQWVVTALFMATSLDATAQPEFGIGISTFGPWGPQLKIPIEWPSSRLRIEPAFSYSSATTDSSGLRVLPSTESQRRFDLQVVRIQPTSPEFQTVKGLRLARGWSRQEYSSMMGGAVPTSTSSQQYAQLLGVIGLEYRINPKTFIAFEAGAGLNWSERNFGGSSASREISTTSSSSMSFRLMF